MSGQMALEELKRHLLLNDGQPWTVGLHRYASEDKDQPIKIRPCRSIFPSDTLVELIRT